MDNGDANGIDGCFHEGKTECRIGEHEQRGH